MIIGITGSVGKTSTREAIFAVLKNKYRVRRAEKNYNNEIGLPLTILGIPHHGRNILGWIYALIRANKRIVWRTLYPEVLVLEYGVDHPGDMDYLLSIVKPNIAVVTAVGDVPVHVEFFSDPAELIKEKSKLIASLASAGYAVLNHDDYAVLGMKEKTRARIMTYGTEEHATFKITDYILSITKDEKGNDVPAGTSFKVQYGGDLVPVSLRDTFGMPQAYAATAAAAVGLILNMNLVEISEALREYNPPVGRLRLIKGIKSSLILDDTYNASPEAMWAALEVLKALPGKRKIVVLGDMLELGRFTEQAHRTVGGKAAQFVDLLFCVGARAKFIAEEASLKLNPTRIFKFDSSEEAGRALDPLIREGDLILVKGSQAIRMEKAIFEIMAEPLLAGKLLVRQEISWKIK